MGYPGCQTARLGSRRCRMALIRKEVACSPARELAMGTVSCDSNSSPFAKGKPSPPLCWQHEMGDKIFLSSIFILLHVIVPG